MSQEIVGKEEAMEDSTKGDIMEKNIFLRTTIFLLIGILLSSIVLATAIENTLHVTVRVTDTLGNIKTGTYTFDFNITNDTVCTTNILYNNQTSRTTDSSGVVDVYLPDVNLPFNEQYYLCYYRDGTLKDTVKIALAPYAFYPVNVDNSSLNSTHNFTMNYLDITKNLTVSENLTIEGNLSVTNNISAAKIALTGISIDGISIDTWTEINTTKEEISGIMGFYYSTTNISSLGYYYDIYNLTSLLNTTYLARTKGNASGNYTFGVTVLHIDDTNDRVGVGTTNPEYVLEVSGDMYLNYTATSSDVHGLELFIDAAGIGDIKAIDIFYDTGAISAGEDEDIILINIDESTATGGDVVGLGVLSTGGSATIYALEAGINVAPVVQLSGSFGDMDSANNSGTDNLAAFISSITDVNIFVNDNDYIIIGDASKFEEVEFLLDTVSSQNINPVFAYSTGDGAWDVFTPVDGTNGMQNNGVIVWLDEDIPSWVVGSGSEYLIRINRTRNNLVTTPIEDKVQIGSATKYSWDKNAGVTILNLTVDTDTLIVDNTNDEVGIGTDSPNASLHVIGSGNFTKNITISENLTVYGNISVLNNISSNSISTTRQCLGTLCIDTFAEINSSTFTTIDLAGTTISSWSEVNVTDTYVTSTNVSAWGVYYYDIYNITSQTNSTYLNSTGATGTGNYSFGALGSSKVLFIDDTNNKVGIGVDQALNTTFEIHDTGDLLKVGNTTDTIIFANISSMGIGTTTPTSKLEVEGNISVDDNYRMCFGSTSCTDSSIYFNGSSLIIQVN